MPKLPAKPSLNDYQKLIRKVDKARKQYDVEKEAADVFWLLIDLCDRLDIDLAKAFKDKESKNQDRVWQ